MVIYIPDINGVLHPYTVSEEVPLPVKTVGGCGGRPRLDPKLVGGYHGGGTDMRVVGGPNEEIPDNELVWSFLKFLE
jgi:hypothetical protein